VPTSGTLERIHGVRELFIVAVVAAPVDRFLGSGDVILRAAPLRMMVVRGFMASPTAEVGTRRGPPDYQQPKNQRTNRGGLSLDAHGADAGSMTRQETPKRNFYRWYDVRPMETARFEELYVVSDLHLGGVTGRPIFFQDQTLAGLFDYLAKRKPPGKGELAVLLNGDVVDTLAEDIDGYVADPEKAEKIVLSIAKYPGFSAIFQAMRRFVAVPGHTLVFGMGNHDLELVYPNVQETILRLLADDDPVKRGQIRFSTSGAGVRLEVGQDSGPRASVLCVHGNEFDKWNAFSPEATNRILRAAVYDKSSELLKTPPNAGTQLVKDVMNDIKRDWPFVDLLKPEIDTVFNVLIALDPKRISAIAGVVKTFGRAATEGAYRTSRILGAQGPASTANTGLTWAPGEQLGKLIGESRSDKELLASTWKQVGNPKTTPEDLASDDEVLGVGRAFVNWLKYALGSIDSTPRKALQAALADWGGGQDTWDLDGKCEVFDGLKQAEPQADVVVAGHTHLRRQKWLRPDTKQTLYLNTGTWARLMRLTPKVLASDELFGEVWNALPAGTKRTMPDGVLIDQPTVAVIRQGQANAVQAALCEFNPGTKGGLQLVDNASWENVGRQS
jgi:UDP-2,3-diacylglucosamine pyrophosphatase LpxH